MTWSGGLVTARAGKIDDDLLFVVLRVEFFVDGGEGAEDEIAGVSHDGGVAWGDAVFGFEVQEAREEIIDGDGGLEFGETGGEIGGEVELFGAV
jgi:hypothetical protein